MQPFEPDSAALTSETADTAGKPVSVDYSGRAVHPVVARVLAVTPSVLHAESTGHPYPPFDTHYHEEPPDVGLAERQAAEVLRWLAQAKRDGEQGCWCHRCLDDLADELDPPKETDTA